MSAQKVATPTETHFATMVAMLQHTAATCSEDIGLHFLGSAARDTEYLSYAALDREARAIATALRDFAGERALLLFPPGADYIKAFFGCLYAGIIAVPAYPPNPNRIHRSQERILGMVRDGHINLLLTTSAIALRQDQFKDLDPAFKAIEWRTLEDIDRQLYVRWQAPNISGKTTAFLQYTSGSTGVPKGVVVSHANLCHNQTIIQKAFATTKEDRGLSWLPLYHDMGLIGSLMQPLYAGIPNYLMSPVDFLRRPLRWLEAIDQYKITISGGPNFAYDLCVNKQKSMAIPLKLDLSSWRVAFNGAEPVRAETVDSFVKAFKDCGFQRASFIPCYGLAEATLFVAGGSYNSIDIEANALETKGVAKAVDAGDACRTLVSSGKLFQDVTIVDPRTLKGLSDGHVGEIWLQSPSVAGGYFNRTKETRETFAAQRSDHSDNTYMRTGDLGFIRDGELFVTGRLKDLIIIRGRNLYPQDIETTARESFEALKNQACAAFSQNQNGQEVLVVVQELDLRKQLDANEVIDTIREDIVEQHDVQASTVVLVKPGVIPRTSSGKVRRKATAALLKEGALEIVATHSRLPGELTRRSTEDSSPIIEAIQQSKSSQDRERMVTRYLRRALAEILGTDTRQLNDKVSLSALGLDSLNEVSLQHRIETDLNLVIAPGDLTKGMRLQELVSHIVEALQQDQLIPFKAKSLNPYGRHPLSQGQLSLWGSMQKNRHTSGLHIARLVSIEGPFNETIFQMSLDYISARQGMMCATIGVHHGEPFQQIHRQSKPMFLQLDVSHWDQSRLDSYLKEESLRKFDEEVMPRFYLLKHSETLHSLLMVWHHITADLWSLVGFLNDFKDVYEALLAGKAPALPARDWQYTDYVHWQDRQLQGENGDRLWHYWSKQLGKLPDPLQLPHDFNNNQRKGGQGHITFQLDPSWTARAQALAKNGDTTLFVVTLSVFGVLLYRYSGQERFIIGSPFAGRTRAWQADMVGYFVNMLPLLLNFDGNRRFADALEQTRKTVRGAFQHQDYPLNLMIERLCPERDANSNPFFDIAFAYQSLPPGNTQDMAPFAVGSDGATLDLGPTRMTSQSLPYSASQFEFSVSVVEDRHNRLRGIFEYKSEFYEHATMERLMQHYLMLLKGFLQNPNQRVLDVPLLTREEMNRVLMAWRHDGGKQMTDRCLHELVSLQVRQIPNETALIFGNRHYTYAEIDAMANQLAISILGEVGRGQEPIAICLERRPHLMITMLAVWKVGRAFVALEPSHPLAHRQRILRTVKPALLICEQHVDPLLTEQQPTLKLSNTDDLPPSDTVSPEIPCLPQQVALISFTADPQGIPRGVALTHQAIANTASALASVPGFRSGDRMPAITSPSHDAAILEMFLPLWVGGTTILITRRAATDGALLGAALERHGATVMQATTATFQLLLSSGWQGRRDLRLWCDLETLDQDTCSTLLEFGPLVQGLFGASETASWASVGNITNACHLELGTGLGTTQLYVLNRHLQLVPRGGVGGLYVAGSSLAQGYYQRPAITAARFIPDPFSEKPGARMFFTGSLAHILESGKFALEGRADSQVSIRGYRVEPGEVKAALLNHHEISEAHVQVRQEEDGETKLIAYVVALPGRALAPPLLRKYLETALPNYMAPAHFIVMGRLPRNSHGQLEERALPELMSGFMAPDYVPPRNALEQVLAEMWAETLGVPQVGIHDNFFELGGHSLIAARITARIRQFFQVELPLREFFANRCVEDQAVRIAELRAGSSPAILPLKPFVRGEISPILSYTQKRQWFLQRLDPQSGMFNIGLMLDLVGKLDVQSLRKSILTIVERHETLRSRYPAQDDQPVCRIISKAVMPLPVIDLSQQYDVNQARQQALQLSGRLVNQAFDLERAPGLRLGLFRLSPREHILAISVHQMVADLWSLSLFVKELQVHYSRHAGLSLQEAPEIAIQYGDYAVWERRLFETNSRAKQLAYWQKRLGDDFPRLELPTDFARSRTYRYAEAMHQFDIPKPLLNAVGKLAREADTTRFIIMLSAYISLIHRYTSAEDITVGTLVANRIRTETEHLIGAFSNTIVLRTDLSGDPSVKSLLRRIRQIALAAYDHQDLPFEKLLETLNPERDLSRSPLFQVAFGLRELPSLEFELPGLRCHQINQPRQVPRCDLVLEVGDEAGWIQYNAELFQPETIALMGQRYLFLLESMLSDPELTLSQLTLEAPKLSRNQEMIMGTALATDSFRGMNALLAKHAQERPNHKAVIAGNESMTYAALEQNVAIAAAALVAEGVGHETPVGVSLPPGTQLFVAMLAILRAGGYYMPLDPKYPAERLSNMLEASGCKIVIGPQREFFARKNVRTIPLLGLLQRQDVTPLEVVSHDPEQLAYVVFTSGSTGVPKGIAVSKRALLNHALGVRRRFQLTPKDRIMQFFSISFDGSLAALFGSVAAGSTYVVHAFDSGIAAKGIVDFIAEQQVTVVNMPTALYRDMVNDVYRIKGNLPECLRLIMIGGEKAGEESFVRLPSIAPPNLILKNAYGPSETANIATCVNWSHPDLVEGQARAFCIGTPWPNYRCYVLDKHARPVPRGIPGQLWIGGSGVARGYLNRPDLTANLFRPDPYAGPLEPGSRMYGSGDRVRLLNDNHIDYLSRLDRQVKIRGYRIEPADLEAALSNHQLIDSVAVEVQEAMRMRRLVAFVQPYSQVDVDHPDLSPNKLNAFARDVLPAFMVPSEFVVMRKFPLNPNGKIDRRALPFPTLENANNTQDLQPPQTSMERMLVRIWSDVLGQGQVGAFDSFFDLGGHSLLAAKLVSRIRDALHIDMPLKAIFEFPVLRDQAAYIEDARLSHRGIDAPPLQAAPKSAAKMLSFSQERLWYMERLEPGSAGNNVAICVRMRGRIDKIQMIRSFETITSRHAILRSYFKEGNHGPQLITEAKGQIDFRLIDMTHIDEVRREAEVNLRCAEESRLPFYLEALPLMRIHIFLLDQSYFMVLLVMHRIIADYRTAELIMREFALLYHHDLDLDVAALPKLTLQHRDYAFWQRQWLKGQILDAQLGYWERKLAWAPELELPLDFERPPVRRYRGKEHHFKLSQELTGKLNQLARVEGMSNNLVVLTGYVLLLSRYAGQSDFCVGMPKSMRADAKLEHIAGPLGNLLTLRIDTSGHPSFGEMLARLRRELFEVHAHQDVPFELVLERIQPDRDLSRPPIFQVMFDYRENLGNQDEHLFEMPDLVIDVRAVDYRVATYDMALSITMSEGELQGVLDYNTDLFEEATIARLLEHYEHLLEDLAREPDTPADRLTLVDNKERTSLYKLSGFDRQYHDNLPLHVLFEQQVSHTPHANALLRANEQRTYGQLNLDANRLAYHLMRLAVAPETVIAVCLPSSFEAITAQLAILKAGGCIFALDRALPFDHLLAALKANQVKLIITTKDWFNQDEREALSQHCRVLDLSSLTATLRGYGTRNPDRMVHPNQLAVLAYHRLSTGGFNCVALTHRNLVHTVEDLPYPMERGSTSLQAAPLSSEVSLLEIWPTLLNGMRLVLVDHYHEWGELPQLVNQHNVQVMWMNAHLFHLLAEDVDDHLISLRRIFIGGDKHSFNRLADFEEQHPQTEIIHCYGALESTALSTHYPMQASDEALTEAPLGKAISNTHLYLLDHYFQPVPMGAFGQIFVAGEGLARGYYGMPHLTAARFLPNPFVQTPGLRMFACGDLGRFRNDGSISFAGHIDRQIRLRGHRIHLSEIEHALREHDQVLDAHVVMDTTTAGAARLVGYIERRPENGHPQLPNLEKELAVFLASRLPSYTIPSVFCILDKLPLDANDAIDETALPKPAEPLRTFQAPRNPIEEVVARIWAQVLGKERLSITDDFFENGGHSLAATRVAARIRNAFGVEIPVRTLFERTVLHMYAEVVVEAVRGHVNRESIPSTPQDQHREPRLSFAQERLWFLDRLDPGLPTYNIPVPIRLTGTLRQDAIAWAFAKIMERHEVLRTRFTAHAQGHAIQVVESLMEVPLHFHELEVAADQTQAEAIDQTCAALALQSFDLEVAPLWRVHLIEVSSDDHILLVNMHHAICDGYSIALFLRELVQLYNAYGTPHLPELPKLDIQYRDYAAWQRDRWQNGSMAQQMAYWKAHLEGAPQSLEIHTDFPRPSVQTYNGAQYTFTMDQAMVEQLQALCLRESVTLYMALLGVYAQLLSRYASQSEVTIGTPATNRFRAETESLLGFFVNTLVTRLAPDPNQNFGQFLHQVRRLTLDAFANQDVPFERLVDEIHPDRDLSRSPLFQVFFSLEDAQLVDLIAQANLKDLQAELITFDFLVAKFDLSLTFYPHAKGMTGVFNYNADLFQGETIARMSEHFTLLVRQILARPNAKLGQFSLLSPVAKQDLRQYLNGPSLALEPTQGLHTAFERWAMEAAENEALFLEGTRISYAQLDARANALAHELLERGIKRETPVALCLYRSIDMVVAMLGSLKAGAYFVPLDPELPDERLELLIYESKARLIIGHSDLQLSTNLDHVTLFQFEQWDEMSQPAHAPALKLQPSQACYGIFTSGTTGIPKLTINTHQGVLNRIWWLCDHFHMNPDDSFLQKTPYFFDVSMWEFFWPLSCGLRLVIARPDSHRDPIYLEQLIQEQRITHIHFVPSMLHAFLEAADPSACTSLRRFFCSGEALSRELELRLFDTFDAELYNFYGPTEAAIEVTYFRCSPEGSRHSVPIGQPHSNVNLAVVDARFYELPIGVPGELLLTGVQLGRGYAGRPDLTARSFIPSPIAAAPGARAYRTGDLVLVGSKGQIEFLGRIDYQVKVRGYRIELGEIEAFLDRHHGISRGVVTTFEAGSGDTRLAAYVVADHHDPSSRGWTPERLAASLRGYLREHLPDYMVPNAVLVLDELPLLPNGKINRRALPKPKLEDLTGTPYRQPRGATEKRLAKIWTDVLGVQQIGGLNNFFQMGGHSLLAAQLVARIREQFRIDLALKDIFRLPVLSEMATMIESTAKEASVWEPPIESITRMPYGMPMSYAQERLWFINRLEPDTPAYNVPTTLSLSGPLDRHILEEAINSIVADHEILRTKFEEASDNSGLQIIEAERHISLNLVDLSHVKPEQRQQAALDMILVAARRPFDLSKEALLRLHLYKLDATHHLLLINMHHIVSDGWSLKIFFSELLRRYQHLHLEQGDPHHPPEVQYVDYAVWQRQWLAEGALKAQLDFWCKRLQGAPEYLDLATDYQRPAVLSSEGRCYRFRMPAELSKQFNQYCQDRGVTLYMGLLAAFSILLARLARVEDLCIGSPTANRSRTQIEQLIGFFVNALVLRLQPKGELDFDSYIQQVRETSLDSFAHQDVPFERLVDALVSNRDMSRAPLFQVVFAFENLGLDPNRSAKSGDLTWQPLDLDYGIAKLDLYLHMALDEQGLSGTFTYAADLFEASTMARYANRLETLLTAIVENPQQQLAALPLLPQNEIQKLHHDWNDTNVAYPKTDSFHLLFEARVKESPNALAVICGKQSLSYQQLNQQANKLARYLRQKGVDRDAAVGLCLHRTPAMLVAMLAIFKAGGAYVPLDPNYPAQRLAHMMRSVDMHQLITDTDLQEALSDSLDFISEQGIEPILIDDHAYKWANLPVINLDLKPNPHQLAYVIFTSGSTGLPKGVGVPQAALVNHVFAVTDVFGFSSRDRVLQFSSISFDQSVRQLFPILWNGGSLILPQYRQVPTPNDLLELVVQQNISVLILPTAYWHQMVEDRDLREGLPSNLRLINVGGEKASPIVLKKWLKLGRAAWINAYGPTEATINTTQFTVDPKRKLPDPRLLEILPIGKPYPNYQTYLLGPDWQPVPIGEIGEVYIGGAGLARGYLNHPIATAEKYIPNPFAGEENAGSRLYRTGDLARYLDTGDLVFAGRVDRQVKIRGFRVELAEIEANLKALDHVETVAIKLWSGASETEQKLVAYLQVNEANLQQEHLQSSALRDSLAQRLPAFMVPNDFVIMSQFPLTPNGKVDVVKLPQPQAAVPRPKQASEQADLTPTQELLAHIWCEVLGVAQVLPGDNFFDLGGHSLMATRVTSRIRKVFEIEFPLRLMFESQDLAELAEAVSVAASGEKQDMAIVAQPRPKGQQGFPLTFGQERMWFTHLLNRPGFAYNVPIALRLDGRLDVAALEQAFGKIFERHEVLRAQFQMVDGEVQQQFLNPHSFQVQQISFRDYPKIEREPAALVRLTQDTQNPIMPEVGPLMRVRLYTLDDQHHYLLILIHHTACDGWSLRIILRELTQLYSAFQQNLSAPDPLPPLQIRYADYAAWQRHNTRAPQIMRQKAYWRKALADVPSVLHLPTDRPRPKGASYRGGNYEFRMDAEFYGQLRQLCADQGVTVFMATLAAYAVLLSRFALQDHFVVGSPVANRHRREIEDTVGLFINRLALVIDLRNQPTFATVLQRIRERALKAYAHQDVPVEHILEDFIVPNKGSATPLFQVFCSPGNTDINEGKLESEIAGTHFRFQNIAFPVCRYDMTLRVFERYGHIMARWDYNSDLFDRQTVETMAAAYVALLRNAVTEPHQQLQHIALLDKKHEASLPHHASRQLLLEHDYSLVDYIQVFVRTAAKKTAYFSEAGNVTNRALDRMVQALAQELQKMGCGDESPVALVSQNFLDYLIGTLAILKIGATVVPLDGEKPKRILKQYVKSLGVSVVVSRAAFLKRFQWRSEKVSWLSLDQVQEKPKLKLLPHPPLTLTQTAMILDVSGDEEQPQPMAISHGTLLSRLLWLQSQYKLGRQDRVWSNIASTQGEGLMCALLPLMFGAALIDPDHSAAHTKATLVCSDLDAPLENDTRWQALSSRVRKLGFVDLGNTVRKSRVKGYDILSGPRLLLRSACYRRADEDAYDRNYLGRATDNVETIVLNTQHHMLPAGFPGKLYIAGAWFGAGWLADPGRTATCLTPFLNATNEGQRLLATDCCVRRKEDGRLFLYQKPDLEGWYTQQIANHLPGESLKLKPGSWQHKVTTALAEVCQRQSISNDLELANLDFNANKAYKLAHKLKQRLDLEVDYQALLLQTRVSDLLQLLEPLIRSS